MSHSLTPWQLQAAGGGYVEVVKWLVEEGSVSPCLAVTKGRHDGGVMVVRWMIVLHAAMLLSVLFFFSMFGT